MPLLTAKSQFTLNLLVVCTGNICRSPTAERLAVTYAARLHIPDFVATSAGTHAVIGHPIHRDAAVVLQKLGGDASNFAARQLTAKVASDADLVVTMTRAHRDAVLELAPRKLVKTFTLIEAARLISDCNAKTIKDLSTLRPQLAAHKVPDVLDPIGQDADVSSRVGSQIAELLTPILELCRRSTAPTLEGQTEA